MFNVNTVCNYWVVNMLPARQGRGQSQPASPDLSFTVNTECENLWFVRCMIIIVV